MIENVNTPVRFSGTVTMSDEEKAELAGRIRAFLIEKGGCRWWDLCDEFLPGPRDSDRCERFWMAMQTLPYIEDDLGDEDCAKPFFYIPSKTRPMPPV
jgi:hypothetical protein